MGLMYGTQKNEERGELVRIKILQKTRKWIYHLMRINSAKISNGPLT